VILRFFNLLVSVAILNCDVYWFRGGFKLLTLACLVEGGIICPSAVAVDSSLAKVAVDDVVVVPFFSCFTVLVNLLLFDTTVLEEWMDACWKSLELSSNNWMLFFLGMCCFPPGMNIDF
jgi:hypothetical protein